MLLHMAVFHSFLIYAYHIFLIQLSVDGNLRCFHVLAIGNSAVVIIEVHISFWISGFIFSGYIPRSGIAGSYSSSIFSFLRNLHSVFPEKAMAPHSSTLAWEIPWTEEPGRLQSMRSQRVGHEWATSLSLSTFMHWGRNWQPTPVLLPGESQGRGSLVGCRLWGRTESDTTQVT